MNFEFFAHILCADIYDNRAQQRTCSLTDKGEVDGSGLYCTELTDHRDRMPKGFVAFSQLAAHREARTFAELNGFTVSTPNQS